MLRRTRSVFQLTDKHLHAYAGLYLGNEVPTAFQGTRTSMGAAFRGPAEQVRLEPRPIRW